MSIKSAISLFNVLFNSIELGGKVEGSNYPIPPLGCTATAIDDDRSSYMLYNTSLGVICLELMDKGFDYSSSRAVKAYFNKYTPEEVVEELLEHDGNYFTIFDKMDSFKTKVALGDTELEVIDFGDDSVSMYPASYEVVAYARTLYRLIDTVADSLKIEHYPTEIGSIKLFPEDGCTTLALVDSDNNMEYVFTCRHSEGDVWGIDITDLSTATYVHGVMDLSQEYPALVMVLNLFIRG